ncbi:MAG: hypothetical protein HOP18_25165 [Deltaproteobacteria bacterium]|nr:hypothetical protein [Deltaproteobacteria bacterium]
MDYVRLNATVDRRVFIRGLGALSLGLLLGPFLGGCEGCLETIKNRPIRRRLRTGSTEVDADLATYSQAVSLMKALPASDPRSWTHQAGIHGTVAGGFNLCQHGTDHFFSWHRAYLFYFERICQQLTGNNDFGLPYWNWNQNPDINPVFVNAASALFHARNNTSVAGFSAFATSTLDTIFSDHNFFTFSSQVEGTPHNTAHIIVGGDMASGGSALDPVFWTHHGMIDYCWAKWNIDFENDNTNDAVWNQTSWDHFVDQDGNPVTVTAGVTTLMPLLSYQYESSAIGSAAASLAARSKADFKKLEARIKKAADIKFVVTHRVRIAEKARISIAQPFSQEAKASPGEFSRLINSDAATESIFASIAYAQLPATSDFYVRVFLNLPTATADTSTDDAHYAGSFAFFGTHIESDTGHPHGPTFLVNLTPTLQKLKRNQALDDSSPLTVQLVAVPVMGQFEKRDTQILLEGIDLIVTPVIIKSK